jgi:sortase A
MSLRFRRAIILALAAFGLWQVGAGLYIHAKAWLAQRLIAASWASTLEGDREARPWPWADMRPVARLSYPDADADIYVLSDASGRSLAFGPGLLSGSAEPGATGNAIIAAHRDTHFRFLRGIGVGEELVLQTPDSVVHRYRVIETRIIDSRTDRLILETEQSMVTLVTCYPFDALVPGGPLRYLVTAIEAGAPAT